MVEYLNYKGENYPFRVSYYAIKHTEIESGKEFSFMAKMDYAQWESLLFYALECGHKKMNKPFSFKREDMEMIMDECQAEFISKIPNFYPAIDPKKVMAVEQIQKVMEALKDKE